MGVQSLMAAALAAPAAFDAWAAQYSKAYPTTLAEGRARATYEANIARIAAHNAKYLAGETTYVLGANEFTDLTADQFAARVGLLAAPLLPARGATGAANTSALPASVDWQAKGVVGPVQNQGAMGSVWVIATLEVLASNAAIASGGKPPALSSQQLVDCTDQFSVQAYTVQKGVCDAASYPAGGDGKCKDSECTPAVKVKEWVGVKEGELPVMTALAAQTLAINHVLQATGYGTDKGNDYFRLKNSWGASWGEQGYIRLGRGAKFDPSGQCGVESMASYPVFA